MATAGTQKAKNAQVAARRAKAVALRNDGRTWQQITDELGYTTAAQACNDVTRAREAAYAEMRENVEVWRDRELARLDMLYDAAVEIVVKRHVFVSGGKVVRDVEIVLQDDGTYLVLGDGSLEPLQDDGPTLQAIETLRKLSESRRKLLGLDAPQRVETTGSVHFTIDGVDAQALT